jgi:N-acetylglucosamine-6-phosphate deacetylase
MLGWHCEGPFLASAKRGAHAHPFLLPATDGIASLEAVYGASNLVPAEDWLMSDSSANIDVGVRVITAAPEVDGVMATVGELASRGVVFSIGHSAATTLVASAAVRAGARLITHLFNAMPQLHHRDPSIIGLLGSSPHLASPFAPVTASSSASKPTGSVTASAEASPPKTPPPRSEALVEQLTPPQTPLFKRAKEAHAAHASVKAPRNVEVLDRPFYELIVDGVHSHPNSVRLAYGAFPEGCILITDAMKILDPHLRDGVHEWRDGQRFVKEGEKLYLEGTDTLAGSVVTLDKCVRNFVSFTGCTLGEALRCATFNPAR